MKNGRTKKKALAIALLVVSELSFSGCPWYKTELKSNKCSTNEQCPSGFACRESRCEDIYYPERKISQY